MAGIPSIQRLGKTPIARNLPSPSCSPNSRDPEYRQPFYRRVPPAPPLSRWHKAHKPVPPASCEHRGRTCRKNHAAHPQSAGTLAVLFSAIGNRLPRRGRPCLPCFHTQSHGSHRRRPALHLEHCRSGPSVPPAFAGIAARSFDASLTDVLWGRAGDGVSYLSHQPFGRAAKYGGSESTKRSCSVQ